MYSCLGCGETYTDKDAEHWGFRCIICGFDLSYEQENYEEYLENKTA